MKKYITMNMLIIIELFYLTSISGYRTLNFFSRNNSIDTIFSPIHSMYIDFNSIMLFVFVFPFLTLNLVKNKNYPYYLGVFAFLLLIQVIGVHYYGKVFNFSKEIIIIHSIFLSVNFVYNLSIKVRKDPIKYKKILFRLIGSACLLGIVFSIIDRNLNEDYYLKEKYKDRDISFNISYKSVPLDMRYDDNIHNNGMYMVDNTRNPTSEYKFDLTLKEQNKLKQVLYNTRLTKNDKDLINELRMKQIAVSIMIGDKYVSFNCPNGKDCISIEKVISIIDEYNNKTLKVINDLNTEMISPNISLFYFLKGIEQKYKTYYKTTKLTFKKRILNIINSKSELLNNSRIKTLKENMRIANKKIKTISNGSNYNTKDNIIKKEDISNDNLDLYYKITDYYIKENFPDSNMIEFDLFDRRIMLEKISELAKVKFPDEYRYISTIGESNGMLTSNVIEMPNSEALYKLSENTYLSNGTGELFKISTENIKIEDYRFIIYKIDDYLIFNNTNANISFILRKNPIFHSR